MGSAKHSKETGVTRTTLVDLPEANIAELEGFAATKVRGECPGEVKLTVVVPGSSELVLTAKAHLELGQPFGVIVRLGQVGVPIVDERGAKLRQCLEQGIHYEGDVIGQEVRRGGIHVTVLFIAT